MGLFKRSGRQDGHSASNTADETKLVELLLRRIDIDQQPRLHSRYHALILDIR